jgi:hypothetical protein
MFNYEYMLYLGVGAKLLIKNKLNGLSPRVNYTDQATAAYRGASCQLLRIEGATWSV